MPTPPLPADEVTRRVLLTGVAAGALTGVAGCTIGTDQKQARRRRPSSASDKSSPVAPDVATAAAALTGEQAAFEAVEATLARHRGLRRELTPMVESHRAHVSLLAEAAPGGPPVPAATSLPAPSTSPFRVPEGERVARARLSALQRTLSTSAKRQSFAAESGAFARLLASMAAAAAQHAALLASPAQSPGSSDGTRS